MPFSDKVIDQVWERSGGRCECTRNSHDHEGRFCFVFTRKKTIFPVGYLNKCRGGI